MTPKTKMRNLIKATSLMTARSIKHTLYIQLIICKRCRHTTFHMYVALTYNFSYNRKKSEQNPNESESHIMSLTYKSEQNPNDPNDQNDTQTYFRKTRKVYITRTIRTGGILRSGYVWLGHSDLSGNDPNAIRTGGINPNKWSRPKTWALRGCAGASL